MLEKKCCTGMEKLKALIEGGLQNGIPVSEILDRSKSILRKALLVNSSSSTYSRDLPRLCPGSQDDLAPLGLY